MSTLGRYGRSFRLAGRLLPGPTLGLAADLYAFCREIDDLADEGVDNDDARSALHDVRHALLTSDECHPLAASLLSLNQRHGVSTDAAITLIDTVITDLDPVYVADEAALLRYAHGVAGTVGLMMCAILDAESKKAEQHAIDLGIAMQMTNIARDVLEDAARGRLYLPATWLPPEMTCLSLQTDPKRVFAAVQMLLKRAGHHYRSAEQGYRYLPRRARPAIRAAARLYEAIGLRILARGPNRLFAGRCVVPLPRKLWIMGGSLFNSLYSDYREPEIYTVPAAISDNAM